MYARILVPIDGSEASALGLEEAMKLARKLGSRLRLMHTVDEYIPVPYYSAAAYTGNLNEALREDGRKILDDAEATARARGIEVEGALIEQIGGGAAGSILDQAKAWPADLIVMGTHGRRGLRRLAMGSDAEQVVRLATVPVLLVRGGAEKPT